MDSLRPLIFIRPTVICISDSKRKMKPGAITEEAKFDRHRCSVVTLMVLVNG